MNLSRFKVVSALLVAMAVSATAVADNKTGVYKLPAVKPFTAIDFRLKGEDGKQYALSQFRGKLVIINFWATWCPPCREEMPSMERAWQKLKNHNIMFLAVNVGETEEEIFSFTATYPVSFPLLMDRNGSLAKQYPMVGLPTTYIVSPDGKVTHKAVGTREWDHPAVMKQLKQMAVK